LYNSNKSPTWCNNFSVYYPDVCLQLNVFRTFSRPSSGAQWLQWQPLVLPSCSGDSSAVFVTDFNETRIFSTDFRKILEYNNLIKILPLGVDGVLADRHNEANSRFSQFCDERKNYYTTLVYVPRKTLLEISAFKQQHTSSRKENKLRGEGIIHAANKKP
jgi:hypothetical protein